MDCDRKSKNKFGTLEWANRNINFINGCSNDCMYCYAKSMAIRFKRKTVETWKLEEINIKKLNEKIGEVNGVIMFPSSHDITPNHIESSISMLSKILLPGNRVLIVTKPYYECIDRICSDFTEYKNNITFRFTIGSVNNEILKLWEPGATDFQERLSCLKLAFDKGFETSVSCEPMLDDKVEDVIRIVKPYVTETIWLGKPNFLLSRLAINCPTDIYIIDKAKELCKLLNDDFIISLYDNYKSDSKIQWKDSIKKVLHQHSILQ